MRQSTPGGITRRQFVAGSAAAVSATLLSFPSPATAVAATQHDRVAVVIHLAGGNDAWHCLAPLHLSDYHSARRGLPLPNGMTMTLPGTRSRLHPSLTAFGQLMTARRAALVCNVALPGGETSHAHASLAWDEASLPRGRPRDGWLARLARSADAPLTLWTDASATPRSMAYADGASATVERPPARANGTLADRLAQLADRVLTSPNRLIAHLTLDGFDTHEQQSERQAALLGELADGLATFDARLRACDADTRVLTLAYSEIGRSLTLNASGGTEHAPGTLLLAVGAGVRPGVHNEDGPPLDFRLLHAAVLDWLELPYEGVLSRRPAAGDLIHA